MITPMPSTKKFNNDFVMESPFVDSILEFLQIDSQSKCSKPILNNYMVEYFMGDSTLKLLLTNSKLECVFVILKPESPNFLPERCRSIELFLFG
jgi:hypothetical protein